ncbi:DHS-like NAD/FAD-binding domain-containing protein [Dichomitus squalens]|uniref:DHS-like NAD/FAD-binding domain-containing protein n=1 Tax=Dichomitus squalens TaxID=114155 RepID=A0A4Q9Q4E2_9APHY|nr:DHS-like NAD/FAD-binding domain-containing protein [Dichomitus squalens]
MDDDELLMLYDGPTMVLDGRDLPSIAKYMKSPQCKRIFVMVRIFAGVSTAAGIPDFRSPRTGLYANLAKLNLPYPRALFELSYFRFNPIPFLSLTRELYPGRFRPTLTHTFVKLLADSGLLHTCFTQNIDTLERQAGIPVDRLVEAHGSFASQHCIDCKKEYGSEKMREAVEKGEVVRCDNDACAGLVKPDVVFFGESLPELLSQSIAKINSADLLFVVGTSLTIQPFARLASMAPDACPRVLINLDFAGDIGTRADDVLLLGKCDATVRELCRALGWEDALEREWAKTALPAARPSTGILSPVALAHGEKGYAARERERSLGDGVPPHEQVEVGRLGGSGQHGTSTPTAAEWQERLDAAESLTERLRVALESSEKIVPLMEEAAVTFAARTLSAEELLLATNVVGDSGESTPVNEGSYMLGATVMPIEGKVRG